MRSALLCSSHQVISVVTYCEAAERGLQSRMNHSASVRPRSMFDQRPVLADIDASSRNTRDDRSRYQGFANRSIPLRSATARVPDAARE